MTAAGEKLLRLVPEGAPIIDATAAWPDWIATGGASESPAREAIASAPARLAPGERLWCCLTAADLVDAQLEQQARQWLRPAARDFDVAVLIEASSAPDQAALDLVRSRRGNARELEALNRELERRGVEQLVLALLIVQRSGSRPSFTVRRQLRPTAADADVEALLAWEARAPSFNPMAAVLEAVPGTELEITHSLVNGDLTPVSYTLRAPGPFLNEADCGGAIAFLFRECVRPRSGPDLYDLMRRHTGATEPDFAAAVKALISAGVVRHSPAATQAAR